MNLACLPLEIYIKWKRNGRMVENEHMHDSIDKNIDVPADLSCSGILGFPVTHIFMTIIEANVINSDINSYAISMY